MILPKYSLGIGDRFGRQGRAQLAALVQAQARGVKVTPVWNKSNREHQITRTRPDSVRAEAESAVTALPESDLMKEYNEQLVIKLDEKNSELSERNAPSLIG